MSAVFANFPKTLNTMPGSGYKIEREISACRGRPKSPLTLYFDFKPLLSTQLFTQHFHKSAIDSRACYIAGECTASNL